MRQFCQWVHWEISLVWARLSGERTKTPSYALPPIHPYNTSCTELGVFVGWKHHGAPCPSGFARQKATSIFAPCVFSRGHFWCLLFGGGRAFAAINTAACSSGLNPGCLLWLPSSRSAWPLAVLSLSLFLPIRLLSITSCWCSFSYDQPPAPSPTPSPASGLSERLPPSRFLSTPHWKLP